MSKFEMVIDNGHIVLPVNGRRFIVDTGSPTSFFRVDETLVLDGDAKKLSLSSGNAQMVQRINDTALLTHEVDGLLGLDVLANKSWEFDFASQSLFVNEVARQNYENSLPLDISMLSGISFDMIVGGQPCKGILDSGAFVSYASSKLVSNVPSCGNVDDNNPILGEIHTTLHPLAIRLGKRDFNIKAGKMTEMLEMMMAMVDVECVLGITMLGLKGCRLDLIHNCFEL